MARQLAAVVPARRAIVFLEGGYNLDALAAAATATVRGWLDPDYVVDPFTEGVDPVGHLHAAREVAARYWKLL